MEQLILYTVYHPVQSYTLVLYVFCCCCCHMNCILQFGGNVHLFWACYFYILRSYILLQLNMKLKLKTAYSNFFCHLYSEYIVEI